MAKKIAIVGTHGTGKSKLCQRLVNYLRSMAIPKSVELVSETVRECPLPIHKEQNLDSTYWIVSAQIKREMEALANEPEYIICDRSVIDPIIYTLEAGPIDVPNYFITFVNEYSKSYDRIVLITPTARTIEPDGFRNVCSMYQLSIHALFVAWLSEKCMHVSADEIFEEGNEGILKRILDLKTKR